MNQHSPKIGIQQRVLPNYRVPFFDLLAEAFPWNVEILAGDPRPTEAIRCGATPKTATLIHANNLHINRGNFYFCWQRGLISWLRRCRPDVLIVEANPRLLSNYIGVSIMKLWGRPVIGWGLGILQGSTCRPWSDIRHHLHRRFYNRFDVLIAYSSKGARDYLGLGIPKDRVFVAPNAVSDENARKLSKKLEQEPDLIRVWKDRLCLEDCPVVLYVGRLTPSKRVGDLIRACSAVNSPMELLIVGDGPERPKLEALAKQLLPRTRFLGHLERQELALCFAGADLFVLPGTGGLAVQEAMTYGKPVIVGPGDGTEADLVKEGKNGFHVTPGDITCLSEIISRCLSNWEALRQMGEESRRIVEKEYNLDVTVQAFLEAIDYVLTRREV